MQVPPCIGQDPKSEEVTIGGNVQLSCKVAGFPSPDVVWLRNGHEVQANESFLNPNKTITIVNTTFNYYPPQVLSRLHIEQVDETDAGTYSCLATNHLTETFSISSVNALLTVLSKFSYKLHSQTI